MELCYWKILLDGGNKRRKFRADFVSLSFSRSLAYFDCRCVWYECEQLFSSDSNCYEKPEEKKLWKQIIEYINELLIHKSLSGNKSE